MKANRPPPAQRKINPNSMANGGLLRSEIVPNSPPATATDAATMMKKSNFPHGSAGGRFKAEDDVALELILGSLQFRVGDG